MASNPFGSLALNSANVPGGLSAKPVKEIIEAGGLKWVPRDAAFDGAPIGYALAVSVAKTRKPLEAGK
ncbi:MAG: hypothetical protein WC054_00235 [Candidatus Nanopelagicales bacterium]